MEEETGAEVQALDVVVEVLDSTPWMRTHFPRYKMRMVQDVLLMFAVNWIGYKQPQPFAFLGSTTYLPTLLSFSYSKLIPNRILCKYFFV